MYFFYRYYVSTQEFRPDVRHLFWASIDAIDSNSPAPNDAPIYNCITCHLYKEECQFNSINLSATKRYYIYGCLGPGVPKLQLRSLDELKLKEAPTPKMNELATLIDPSQRQYFDNASINNRLIPTNVATATATDDQIATPPPITQQITTDKTLVWAIEDNFDLREKLKIKAMPQVKRLSVPVGKNGQYNASVLMLLPAKLKDDDDPNTQYPMVVNVYAGPGSQRVDQRFDLSYGHYMASNKNIIYTMIDGRGSGYQGSNMLYEVYHRFGSVEIEDQISVTR